MYQPLVRTEVVLRNQALNLRGISCLTLPSTHQSVLSLTSESEAVWANCTALIHCTAPPGHSWAPSDIPVKDPIVYSDIFPHLAQTLLCLWLSHRISRVLKGLWHKALPKASSEIQRDYNQTLNYSTGLMRHDLRLKHPVYCCLVMFLLISFCITVPVNSLPTKAHLPSSEFPQTFCLELILYLPPPSSQISVQVSSELTRHS